MAVTHPEELGLQPAIARPSAPSMGTLVAILAGLVLLVLALTLAAMVAWSAYERIHLDRAYQGVSVAGVDLGGMTAAEATAALTPVLAERFGGVAEVSIAGIPHQPTYAELGRSADVASTVEAAMAVGRAETFAEQVDPRIRALTSGWPVEPRMAFDRAALAAWVARTVAPERRAPTPASVALDGRRLEVTPDSMGVGIDQGALVAALEPALADPASGDTVSATATTVPLESDTNDVDILATKVAVARIAKPVNVTLGKKTWTFSAPRVRSWIRLAVAPSGAVPTVDQAAVRADLAKVLAKKVKRKPLQTRFLVTKSGKKFGFVAGKPGRQLDATRTAQRVVAQVLGRRIGLAEAGAVAIATKGVDIKVSAEEAAEIVPQVVLLGAWTTYFPQGERNGNGVNIHLPARILNGTVLSPGEVLDFVRRVGPFSWERGYRMGGIIQGSRTLPSGAVAGGICSASTTMFNAAARAGLDILSRDNHSYYITRYPLGLDATVSTKAGRVVQNMRFRNDTPHAIYIAARWGFGWVRFELYSLERTRQVVFSRPQVWNRLPAGDRVVYTDRLPRGTSERLEYPSDGMDVAVTRTVRDMRGRVIHRETFRSHYVRWNGLLEVGTR